VSKTRHTQEGQYFRTAGPNVRCNFAESKSLPQASVAKKVLVLLGLFEEATRAFGEPKICCHHIRDSLTYLHFLLVSRFASLSPLRCVSCFKGPLLIKFCTTVYEYDTMRACACACVCVCVCVHACACVHVCVRVCL